MVSRKCAYYEGAQYLIFLIALQMLQVSKILSWLANQGVGHLFYQTETRFEKNGLVDRKTSDIILIETYVTKF